MKNIICVSIVIFAFMAICAISKADKKIMNAGNMLCPVSGESVNEMGGPKHAMYNGKEYNFCCGMCINKFKKDPDKFGKIADNSVKNQ